MPLTALALILAAAFCHATWNLILKRSRGGGILFFWLVAWIESLVYAPVAVFFFVQLGYWPDARTVVMMLGSALIHVAYFVFLDRGYRTGEQGSGFALATGAMIAIYTVWDRQAVVAFLIPPVIFYWGSIVLRLVVTTPVALRQMAAVKALWASERRAIVMVAVLSPLSYCLALFAMKMAPLSYVAPAREISILIAALYGTHFLKEGDVARRLSAAVLMVLGLTGIALA